MYLRLSQFLVDAAILKGSWEEAASQANHKGEDFVHRAIGLGRGLPEWEAWQACEPLEWEIMDFVGRAYGRVGTSRLDVGGNFRLLAATVEEQILQVREWQQSLLTAAPGLEGCYVPTAGVLATGRRRAGGLAVASPPSVHW